MFYWLNCLKIILLHWGILNVQQNYNTEISIFDDFLNKAFALEFYERNERMTNILELSFLGDSDKF